METDAKIIELSEKHWSYINELLLAHGEKIRTIDKCKFHYISAFIHGWKHAKEDQTRTEISYDGRCK